MKRRIGVLTALVAALSILTSSALATADTTVDQQLAAVRAATAKYHDVSVAIADGYLPTDECAELPGVGGMGYHYVNPALFGMALDPLRPAILLYVPTDDGIRLGGVEYAWIDADQDLATADDRPSLFGVPFDGPMPGHFPGMPVHYDLHVWIWDHNLSGTFAQWNPGVTCP